MLAVVFQDKENFQFREIDKPVLPDGGLIIRIKACAICGTDVRTYYHGNPFFKPPWVIGHEIAGQIVEIASGVNCFQTGDRVAVAAAVPCGKCRFCMKGWRNMCVNVKAHGFHYPGGFAEFMAVAPEAIEQGAVNLIPDHVSYDEATLAEPLACVINSHELLNISLVDTVAVIGAGPVGCMHIEAARIQGASRIIHVEMNPKRLEQAKAFKADLYIDSCEADAVEKVKSFTCGYGADVVIVACASKSAQEQALHMAAIRGRISLFAGLPNSDPCIRLNANIVHYKEISVYGAFTSKPEQNKTALDLIASGRIHTKELITHNFPLKDLIKGIQIIENAKGLKVIINP